MRSVKLYYNPTAGEGDNSKKDLIHHLKKEGYEVVSAVHRKKGLNEVEPETDILVVAGGDGTVRNASLELLHTSLKDSRPIGLLALGTANNVANTLNIGNDITKVIRSWSKHLLKRFDVGRIEGWSEQLFFVESFGFGIFPAVIAKMRKIKSRKTDAAEKEFKTAMQVFIDIAAGYDAVPCDITIDGKDYSGRYIMVEVLNIRSLGPKLMLAPDADPGDGQFEVILIPDGQRKALLSYLEKINKGIKAKFPFPSIKGRDIKVRWDYKKDIHVDDEVLKKYKPVTLQVKLLDAMLDFLVSAL